MSFNKTHKHRTVMNSGTLVLQNKDDQALAVVTSDDWSKVTATMRHHPSSEEYQIILTGVNGGLKGNNNHLYINVDNEDIALKNMDLIAKHIIGNKMSETSIAT